MAGFLRAAAAPRRSLSCRRSSAASHTQPAVKSRGFPDGYDSLTIDTVTVEQVVIVNGAEVVTFSHATFRATPKNKAPNNHSNAFAGYWKKESDGIWRIAYEINADGIVPESPR